MTSDAHTIARIPAYRLGLLEPDDAVEVREHLRACGACRDAFEPFREPSDEEERRPGHLPIALITRWDTFAPLMTEDERTCLEEHFESCPRCREGRAFARLLPDLPSRQAAPSRQAWLGFGTGIAALLAVAAIVVLRGQSPSTLASKPAPPITAPVEIPNVAMPILKAPILSLSGIDRSSSAAPVVRVPKGSIVLPIRVPPLLGVGPDARIRIRVEGPGGIDYGRAELAHRKLFGTSPAASLDVHAPSGPLQEGEYRVHVTSNVANPQAPGGFEGAEYGFDLLSQ